MGMFLHETDQMEWQTGCYDQSDIHERRLPRNGRLTQRYHLRMGCTDAHWTYTRTLVLPIGCTDARRGINAVNALVHAETLHISQSFIC